jgi:hypothetical protein
MRKLEAEHIAPEGERPLEIRNRDAGMVRGEDFEMKTRSCHESVALATFCHPESRRRRRISDYF